jgi:hypothetical protein
MGFRGVLFTVLKYSLSEGHISQLASPFSVRHLKSYVHRIVQLGNICIAYLLLLSYEVHVCFIMHTASEYGAKRTPYKKKLNQPFSDLDMKC